MTIWLVLTEVFYNFHLPFITVTSNIAHYTCIYSSHWYYSYSGASLIKYMDKHKIKPDTKAFQLVSKYCSLLLALSCHCVWCYKILLELWVTRLVKEQHGHSLVYYSLGDCYWLGLLYICLDRTVQHLVFSCFYKLVVFDF